VSTVGFALLGLSTITRTTFGPRPFLSRQTIGGLGGAACWSWPFRGQLTQLSWVARKGPSSTCLPPWVYASVVRHKLRIAILFLLLCLPGIVGGTWAW
jgi:hypothetical protein